MEEQKYIELRKKLPSSVKMKLDHILRFLGASQKKASIMVGAGFSLNANRDSSADMKDWNGLGKMFYHSLFGENPSPNTIIDPIRLASQIEACFGKNELNELILKSLPDDKITPGSLHYQLVKLPWRDIFTTNYDTLIERAAYKENPTFTVVTNRETLLYKPFPRIIKLHGSFKEIRPFVISEEDYRTYPQTHPEFVNTVRQSLIEGLLCLVGFSGNDPNFLGWIGWLRDVMGENIAPIYLVNVSSNLHESEIRLNQQRGISIIDLGWISNNGKDDVYKERLDFFFTYLSKGLNDEQIWKPDIKYRWSETDNIQDTIKDLRAIRKTYPGWHLLPSKYYSCFDNIINEIPFIDSKLTKWELTNDVLVQFLYELDWINHITCTPYNLKWFIESVTNLNTSIENLPDNLKRKLLSLNISLLELYRSSYDIEKFEAISDFINNYISSQNATELTRRYTYEKALFALVTFNRSSLISILNEWRPQDSDYIGILWKSSILLEIGEEYTKEAFELLSKSTKNIKVELLMNNSSKELLSLQSISEQVLSIARSQIFYTIDNSGFINENENLSFNRITESFRLKLYSQKTKPTIQRIHKFGIGSFTTTRNFGGRGYKQEYLQSYRYLKTYERAGFPYGLPHLNINTEGITFALSKLFPYSTDLGMSVLLRTQNKNINDEILNRELLSSFNKENAQKLFSIFFKSENYENKALGQKFNYELYLLSILSRLSIKLETKDITNLLNAHLQSYSKNETNKSSRTESRPEDIKIIYSCLSTNILSEFYPTILEVYINSEHSDEIPLPRRYFKNILVSDDLLGNFISKLSSPDSERRIRAYNGIATIYKVLSENQKDKVDDNIKNWRNTQELTPDMLVSFNLVPPGEDEMVLIIQYLNNQINTLLELDTADSTNSIPLQSATSILDEISPLSHFIENTGKENLLIKINNILNENKDSMFKEESGLFSFFNFGGNFVISLTNFITTLKRGEIKDDILTNVIISLNEYLKHNYAVLEAIVQLNSIMSTPLLGKKEIISLVKKRIFSNEFRIRNDALNAMINPQNAPRYRDLINEMIKRIEIGTNESISNVLTNLCSLFYHGLLDATNIKRLPLALKTLYNEIQTFPISETIKTDIYYFVLEFVGALSANHQNEDLSKVVSLWKNYADSKETFSDVRIGFEKGYERITKEPFENTKL